MLAGGVCLNGSATFPAFQASPFEHVFIQPAAGDAGGSMGAALCAWHSLTGERVGRSFNAYIGPSYGSNEIESFLKGRNIAYKRAGLQPLLQEVVDALAAGHVVGWFQGPMEVGPRALGARSILANPRVADMRDRINKAVKLRDHFQPFAPAILEEWASDYLPGCRMEGPWYYMQFIAPCHPNIAGLIPAVVHVDGTMRPQLVNRTTNPRFYNLIVAFRERTGLPLLLNTSFNLTGEPIVQTPEDAYRTFLYCGLDMLVLEDCIVRRG